MFRRNGVLQYSTNTSLLSAKSFFSNNPNKTVHCLLVVFRDILGTISWFLIRVCRLHQKHWFLVWLFHLPSHRIAMCSSPLCFVLVPKAFDCLQFPIWDFIMCMGSKLEWILRWSVAFVIRLLETKRVFFNGVWFWGIYRMLSLFSIFTSCNWFVYKGRLVSWDCTH